ncbi:uncharacterized protein C8R40DRAFT_43896 [Lentinula edodes]|uniref:uncharacterized protein n=1 Tax=Lentinula edodes TaxID=5353 RepID=UPI001E8DFFF4|nr:uncharacterized protein C8R40DRAFT_43896 [Lentinula edodes]KAH7881457.1 hypothetical protein C8R40DRAFT_43896 [Lentinula edodes]
MYINNSNCLRYLTKSLVIVGAYVYLEKITGPQIVLMMIYSGKENRFHLRSNCSPIVSYCYFGHFWSLLVTSGLVLSDYVSSLFSKSEDGVDFHSNLYLNLFTLSLNQRCFAY